MLYDQFSDVHLTRQYQSLPYHAQQGYQWMREKIAHAPRYVLDRAATMMVQNTSLSRPSAFVKAMSICRLPAPVIWVEITFRDRYDWTVEANRRGMLESRDPPNASQPSRLGFLLIEHSIDAPDGSIERVIEVQCAWTHNPPYVDLSLKGLYIAVRPDTTLLTPDSLAAIRADLSTAPMSEYPSETRKQLTSAKEIDAATELEGRIKTFIPQHFRQTWAEARASDLAFMHESADYDMISEWRFVMALLVVANSRNLIKQQPEVDYVKLNKKRVANRKPPLLSHRPITLNLSPVQKQRVIRYVYDFGKPRKRSDPLEPQFVLGHWKVRETGVFWWTEHPRVYGQDNADTANLRPRTYRVTA